MNRLFSLQIRSANEKDQKELEKNKDPTPYKLSAVVSPPEEDLSGVLKAQELIDNPPPAEDIVNVVEKKVEVPKGPQVKVEDIKDEDVNKLYKRLPDFKIDNKKPEFVRPAKSLKPPLNEKFVKITFPPKDQLKKSDAQSTSGKNVPTVELMVRSKYPTGRISDLVTPIRINFSHPMYQEEFSISKKKGEIDRIQKKIKRIIDVTPPLPPKGIWSWENPTTAVFTPNKDLGPDGMYCPSNSYTVTIKAGIKSLRGNMLKSNNSFSFSTTILYVKNFLPRSNDPRILTKNPVFAIEFSQKVDHKKLFKKMYIAEGGSNSTYEKCEVLKHSEVVKRVNNEPFFTYQVKTNVHPGHVFKTSADILLEEKEEVDPNDPKKTIKTYIEKVQGFSENTLFFTTKKRLIGNRNYSCYIQTGLEPVRGNLKTNRDYRYNFTTMENLCVRTRNLPSSTYENDTVKWYLEMNNPLNISLWKKRKKKLVTIKNLLKSTFFYEEKTKRIHVEGKVRPWKKKLSVEITLSKKIEDIYGNCLPNDLKFSSTIYERVMTMTASPDRTHQHCYDNVSWNISFSYHVDPIQFEKLKKAKKLHQIIEVHPQLRKQDIVLSGNRITIHGNPVGHKEFLIKLKKKMLCVHETNLIKDYEVKITMYEESKLLQSQHNNQMIVFDPTNPTTHVNFTFTARNYDKVRILVYRVDPEEDYHKVYPLGYYKPSVHNWSHYSKLYKIQDLIGINKKKIVFDKEWPTKGIFNEKKVVKFNLEKHLQHSKEKLGQVFVCVTPIKPDYSNSLYCWIQSTKSAVDCVFSNDKMLTMIGTNLVDGSFVANPSFIFSRVTGYGTYETKKIVERDKRGTHDVSVYSWYKNVRHQTMQVKKGGKEGITYFNFAKERTFTFEGTYNLVVMKNGKDVCFVKDLRNSNTSDSYKNKNRILPFVFDDKKMFKPKEKAHVKAILRKLSFDNNERKLLFVKKGTVVKYKVTDSRKVNYIEEEAEVDDCSCVYFQIKIPPGANLGDHKIEFEVVLTESDLYDKTFNHIFKVQEFENPEFISKCNVFNKKYYLDDKAIVTAQANYYSGAGLYNCDVKWTVTQSTNDNFRPSGPFGGYNFKIESGYRQSEYPQWRDYSKQPKGTYTLTSNCKTNTKGEHKLFVEIHNPRNFENMEYYQIKNRRNLLTEEAKIKSSKVAYMKVGDKEVILPKLYDKAKDIFSTIKVNCKALITDISQNVLSTGTNFMIHPSRYYVGIKKETNSCYSGDTMKLSLVVVDPDGKFQKDVPICLEVYRSSELMKVLQFKSEMKPMSVEIPIFEEWSTGSFIFVATVFDKKGYQNAASTNVYVSYSRTQNVILNTADIDNKLKSYLLDYPIGYNEGRVNQIPLQVILDKDQYNVGDIAKVSVVSPIFGDGYLFVFASSCVYKMNFKLARTKERTFEIKVDEKFVPNVQIHCLVTGFSNRIDLNNFEIPVELDATAKPMPAFAKTFVSCRVSNQHFVLKASVEPLEKIMSPSEASKCVVKVEKKGKSVVTLLIVDESVLALTGYNLSFPIHHWYPSNVINILTYFLRPYVSVRLWKPNLKMIEDDKKRLKEERNKRIAEIKIKEAQNLRKVEARKVREALYRKKLEEENERRRLYQMKKRQEELKNQPPPPPVQLLSSISSSSYGLRRSRGKGRGPQLFPSAPKKSFGFKKMRKKKSKRSYEREERKLESLMDFAPKMRMKDSFAPAPSFAKKSIAMPVMLEEECEDEDDSLMGAPEPEPEPELVIEDSGDEDTPIAMRKLFESTVIFASAVKTDEEGKVLIDFKLPDNLTKYKIWCLVEQGPSFYGFCENSLVAKLPFNVRPQVPTFLNFGDRCELGFVLSNQSEATLKLRTAFRTTDALQNFGKKGYTVTIPKGLRGEIKFPVLARDIGDSKIQIAASAGKFNDAVEKLIKIYSPSLVSNFVIHGELDADANHIQQVIPPTEKEVYPGFGGLEIQTSSTVFQQLTDAFLYVYGYQYDCIEQTASRILSIYSMIDIVTAFNLKEVQKKDEIINVMKAGLTRLSKAQQGNGGFGWWNRNSKINVWLSNHCAHAILRVREKYPKLFDKSTTATKDNFNMLEKSKKFVYSLTSYIPIGYRANASKSVRAFSLYVLACYHDLKMLSDKEIKQCSKRIDQLVKDCGNCNSETNETKAWLAYALATFSNKKAKDSRITTIMTSLYSCLQEEKNDCLFQSFCYV